MKEIPDIDVREKLALLEGADIKDPGQWDVRKRILDRHISGKESEMACACLGSKRTTRSDCGSGEVSVWAGFNAHNKTTIMSQVAVWASREVPVGIVSLEMELEDTYYLMARQAAGGEYPDNRWMNDFLTWCQERIYVYDVLDSDARSPCSVGS